MPVGEEAKVADAHETAGQQVKQEAAQELFNRQGHEPLLVAMRGPYQFTRNPMYVAELGLWLGSAIFFGSPGVLIGLLVLWSVVTFIILPREERSLEVAFGQTYLQYKSRVPPWF